MVRVSCQNMWRSERNDITLQVLKERSCQLQILYLIKLPLKNEGEVTFPQKATWNELLQTCPYRLTKNVLQIKSKGWKNTYEIRKEETKERPEIQAHTLGYPFHEF